MDVKQKNQIVQRNFSTRDFVFEFTYLTLSFNIIRLFNNKI